MSDAIEIIPRTNNIASENGIVIFTALDTSTPINAMNTVYLQINGVNYNEFEVDSSTTGYYQGVMVKNVFENDVYSGQITGLEGYKIIYIPFSS